MGAGVGQVIGMLSREFVTLVLIASAIAFPVAWYCMHTWLNNFAYRVPVSWWIFAGTRLVTTGIAVITVGFQVIKSAMANPVNSIRAEQVFYKILSPIVCSNEAISNGFSI